MRAINWSYESSLEYFQPKVEAPDTFNSESSNVVPNLIGHIDYNRPWGKVRAGAMVTSNKVKFDESSQSSDVGLALLLGAVIHLDENNLIKTHLIRTDGNSTYIPDYSAGGQKVDMAYNPASNEFSNLRTLGGQIALEHKWNENFSSSIGGGFMNMKNEDYQQDLDFNHGYKALVNLFYRPGGWLKNLVFATELEFAGQTTKDGTDGDTARLSFLAYYDW